LRASLRLDEARFAQLDLPFGEAFRAGSRVGAAESLFPRIERPAAEQGKSGQSNAARKKR
jgi:hypothetical protein